jgi:nucleotide-binding universal stress UspA family protein
MSTQSESVRTIAVGVDGSPQSEAALRWALREAEDKAHVRAIVVRPHEDLLPGTSFAMLPRGRRPIADEPDYADRLHATVEATRSEFLTPAPITEVVVSGDPATELIKASMSADLLVVGSHGARPLAELLLGSVATQCVRYAHCPVVVITAEAAHRVTALQ